jgi:hypothetical protein
VPAGSYTARQWSMIALVSATLFPLILVRFFGVGGGSAATIVVVTGLAIVAASFALSWGVEALEGVMPQGVARDRRLDSDNTSSRQDWLKHAGIALLDQSA